MYILLILIEGFKFDIIRPEKEKGVFKMAKNLPEVFDILNGKKPASPVFMTRVPMFDPIARVDDKGNVFVHRFKYGNYYVTINRPYLSVVDQKIFYTLLRTGKFIKETEESFVFHYDFAEFKKIAGLNSKTEWKELEKSFKRLSQIMISLETKKEKEGSYERYYVMTHALNKVAVVEKKGKVKFEARFSKELIGLLKRSSMFTIPIEQLQELNSIKNPVIYRILTFFATQTKKQSWELFNLLKRLTPMEFDTKDKRYRILKAIEENTELLKKYGITTEEQREGKTKTFTLHFKKPKSLKLEMGFHI